MSSVLGFLKDHMGSPRGVVRYKELKLRIGQTCGLGVNGMEGTFPILGGGELAQEQVVEFLGRLRWEFLGIHF